MPLFEIKKGKATKVNQKEFKDELELHKLIDKNLEEIFNIRFIRDEYITDKHGRIETLGIDENNRPVVIEYKKCMEEGQLVQANRYITWVKQNPDSFELLIRKNIKNFEGSIDFTNPRIICFAQEFSINDKCLALSLDAELWKYRYYETDMLFVTREEEPEQLIKKKGSKTYTIQKIKRDPRPKKTIEELFQGAAPELFSIFTKLDETIMGISSEIERYTTSTEVLYKTSFNFVCLAAQKKKNRIRIYLRTIQDKINDPKQLTEKVPEEFGYGNITRVMYLDPNDFGRKYSLGDIMELILQSYNTTQ